jgi:ribosomal protein L32
MAKPSRQEREQARAEAWLAEKWTGSKECPICGHSDWAITAAMELRQFNLGQPSVLEPVFPVFHAVCTTCGFLHTFSAILANVALFADEDSGEVLE